jgi:co-chaperonin GroES (HSP10)
MDKEPILVGDRVLIFPEDDPNRTETGLYLPQGVKEKEKVQTGRVIKVGPGYPIPDPAALDSEPWQSYKLENKYLPLQAKEGDYCIFLRSAAIEVEFEGKKYVVVPHSAILVLLRGNLPHEK